jgi:hypothetical protein
VWGKEGGAPLPHPTPRPGRVVGVGMLTGEVFAELFITLAHLPAARPNQGLPAHQIGPQNDETWSLPWKAFALTVDPRSYFYSPTVAILV